MKILVIEQSEDHRADLKRRVDEAARSTGMKNMIVESIEMKQLGGSTPDLIVLGSFAKNTILEIHTRVNSIFPNVPIVLLLNTNDYLEDAVELYKRTLIRIVALGDLPQLSQILINLAQPTEKSNEYRGKARIISFIAIKGGTGTSTLASSLATCYGSKNISSLLVDFNYVNRDLSAISQYSIESQSALTELFKIPNPDLKNIKPSIQKYSNTLSDNVSIIGSPSSFLESFELFSNNLPVHETNPSWTEVVLGKLSDEFETIIIDLGNHWGVSALASLALSTHVMLVVEETEWCFQRTFDMLSILSNESEDPGEFDFRKWKIIVNGIKSEENSKILLERFNGNPALIKNPGLYGISWNKKIVDWLSITSSAYEIGDQIFKDSIIKIANDIRPT